MQAGSELSGRLGTALHLIEQGRNWQGTGACVGTKHTARCYSAEGECRRSGRTVLKMPLNGRKGTRQAGLREPTWRNGRRMLPCGALEQAALRRDLTGRSKNRDAESEAKPFEMKRRRRPNEGR
jgi:hypothetical protein